MNVAKKLFKKLKSIRFPLNLWNRMFVVVLIIFGILFFLFSLIGLINKVSGLRLDSRFQNNIVVIEPPKIIDVSIPELINMESCQNCVSLTLEAQQFFPTERQLIGVIHINIPNSVKERLWSNNEYIVLPDTDYPNNLTLRNEYKELEISLIIFSSYLSTSESEIKIPLFQFFADPANNTVSVPVSIKFSGDLSTYPGDWYHAENWFSINLPNAISFRNGDSGFGGTLPFNMFISTNSQIGNFDIKVRRNVEKNINKSFFLLEMLIGRDQITKHYIYLMASLPVLLSFVFAHSNCSNHKNKGKIARNFIIEVSAVIFSVLPLRTVLVPSYIDGLVTIDLILGFGIALMVLIALIIYAREVWK